MTPKLIEGKFADLESRMSAMEKGTTNSKNSHGESTKDRARNVPIECKAVLHGFKAESKEEVKSVIEDSIKATGMKEEYTIDCPAVPITHACVEFQNMKIRDRYVRSANIRKIELDGRRIKISPVLEAEERFDRKRSSSSAWQAAGRAVCVAHSAHLRRLCSAHTPSSSGLAMILQSIR